MKARAKPQRRTEVSTNPRPAKTAILRKADDGENETPERDDLPREILVVASKLKIYVRARSELNTSDGCLDALSEELREICEAGIRRARKDERKTVMERDFPPVPKIEDPDAPKDVLIVVSKLKEYIRASSEMNTSDDVKNILSDHLRRICETGMENAKLDGRKTLLDRDFR